MKRQIKFATGLFAVVLSVAAALAAEPTVTKSVVLEDFEFYTNNVQLAKAWYKPPHGGGTKQTLEATIKGSGKQALKREYSTTKEAATHYSPICPVAKWDASGCNAAQFWLKPDGSGRQITFQLNIANREGKNIHVLWQTVYVPAKGDTAGRIVTIPFAKLEQNVKYACQRALKTSQGWADENQPL